MEYFSDDTNAGRINYWLIFCKFVKCHLLINSLSVSCCMRHAREGYLIVRELYHPLWQGGSLGKFWNYGPEVMRDLASRRVDCSFA